MSIKSKILDFVRIIVCRIPFIEKLILEQLRQGNVIAQKLLAGNHLYPKNSIRHCTRNNINYELDISDYMQHAIYFHLTQHVDFDRRKLYSLIQANFVCIDIGANIGETTLNFAQIAKNGKVYSFEPVPFLFEQLIKNISLNDYNNIAAFNIAIADNEEDLFFEMPSNKNSAGISLNKQQAGTAKRVVGTTLDNFIRQQNIPHIDFIKIDVEGFEYFVLKGATQTILQHRPILFIEIDNSYLSAKNTSEKEVLSYLQNKLGYTLYRINGIAQEKINNLENTNLHYDVLCVFE